MYISVSYNFLYAWSFKRYWPSLNGGIKTGFAPLGWIQKLAPNKRRRLNFFPWNDGYTKIKLACKLVCMFFGPINGNFICSKLDRVIKNEGLMSRPVLSDWSHAAKITTFLFSQIEWKPQACISVCIVWTRQSALHGSTTEPLQLSRVKRFPVRLLFLLSDPVAICISYIDLIWFYLSSFSSMIGPL